MQSNHQKCGPYPMRIQVLPGSEAEYLHYRAAKRHSDNVMKVEALAPRVPASPKDDLIFRGGKTIPQMGFQNIYLGQISDYAPGDIEAIDDAIKRLMLDNQLKDIIQQYFKGKQLSYDVAESVVLDESRPNEMEEADVQDKIIELFDKNLLHAFDHDRTCFNLILPPNTILKLSGASSSAGLGGYHGSVHFFRNGQQNTLYYSANVYSTVKDGRRNGIPFFQESWKNIVCTLYHELVEFQTDPDVSDAIRLQDLNFQGWSSNFGQEIGDQPLSANSLDKIFKEIITQPGSRLTPVQFIYSNMVHGTEEIS